MDPTADTNTVASTVDGKGLQGSTTPADRQEWLRWSNDKLLEALKIEEDSRERLRGQAHAGFLLVPPIAAFAMLQTPASNEACWLHVIRVQSDVLVLLA